jgi:riboflavin biosynthesis pyrimidine reductase
MPKPYIICHMLTALDGKITGPFMQADAIHAASEEYERINATFDAQAWLCSRVTSDENFTFHKKPALDEHAAAVPDGDYVARSDAQNYYVTVDAAGKLGWETNTLHYKDRKPAHIIEVLTQKAGNAYRAFLRKKEISYIVAGKHALDCGLAVEKLRALFNIEVLPVTR